MSVRRRPQIVGSPYGTGMRLLGDHADDPASLMALTWKAYHPSCPGRDAGSPLIVAPDPPKAILIPRTGAPGESSTYLFSCTCQTRTL